jgi:hypothetical protein
LQFTGTVNAVVERHGAGEYTPGGAEPEENVPSGSQTPKTGCLRQPACPPMLCRFFHSCLRTASRINGWGKNSDE